MTSAPFRKILIANRGEIAIRIARAATELGIRTVGVYSYEDRFSQHRFKTDESYRLGTQGKPLEAYLDGKAIVKLASKLGVDGIHPGYGFLSENDGFRELCDAANIQFMGPSADILRAFGDKAKARRVAEEAGLRAIPGHSSALLGCNEALEWASQIGYPVMLKAIAGGGGKGIRRVDEPSQMREAFERVSSEAKTSFGKDSVYIEKMLVSPRHIEVQVLGDRQGNIVHLFERDCSIQRRNQKIVEVAPALGISEVCRKDLQEQALKLARFVNYEGLGTVEFLVDSNEQGYFLEVNPRIQVEHTITEMVTGIDLVHASILVAGGISLSDPRIGIRAQVDIECRGTAIQCRVTTEDPRNSFAPDTGQIIAYRPAGGFGVRIDEGLATAGGIVTPHFDSLLVKLCTWASTLEGAAEKMHRSLSEFRIRGVHHNIDLLKSIVRHPKFVKRSTCTDFLLTHPEIYEYEAPKDRATKLLRYLAEVTINDPHGLGADKKSGEGKEPRVPLVSSVRDNAQKETAKAIFAAEGPKGLVRWIKSESRTRLLLTDTTMRDAHQSLFATRLRTRDILKIAPYYAQQLPELFSIEMWGGATFDTALRFLKEDPWERLSLVRGAVPNVLLQMLLRGDNAVGYTNYPAWVVRDFVAETCRRGLDVFRIFDCFNQIDKMKVAFDAVKHHGAIAEICLCYTGNICDPKVSKYNLDYYVKTAKEIAAMGADILCIKDMAGLLRPQSASLLISALKQAVDLPIHFHTHDTSGVQVATALAASQAGCEIIDAAVSSMAGLTSQPSLNALVASLAGTEKDTQIPLEVLDDLALYWAGVRDMYSVFDPGIRSTTTDVYVHEIPGGQYSNLFEQAKKVGLSSEEFVELTKRYKEANDALGDLIKVTPSSKVVGDLALLLQKREITGPEWLKQRPALDYPDSLISFMKGELGDPPGGISDEVKTLVLGDQPIVRKTEIISESPGNSSADSLSERLYPKVFKEYCKHIRDFGRVSELPTPVFFFGLDQDCEIEIDVDVGKTLYIALEGVSEADSRGKRTVFFRLNGFQRAIEVLDASILTSVTQRPKGDMDNPLHITAAMPGKVLDVAVSVGQVIKAGDLLLVTESMKMEYVISARQSGIVKTIQVVKGDSLESGDLLLEFQPNYEKSIGAN